MTFRDKQEIICVHRFEQLARTDVCGESRGKFVVAQAAAAQRVGYSSRKGSELSSAGDLDADARSERLGKLRSHGVARGEALFPDRIQSVQSGVALRKKGPERFLSLD